MIVVDRREGSAYLTKLLPPGLSQVQTLPYGDACWYGFGPGGERVGVGVECKRVGDLLQCLRDGRFVGHQLPGMLLAYQFVYLLVEGVTRPDPATGRLQYFHEFTNGAGGKWQSFRLGAGDVEYTVWETHLETLRRKTPLRLVHSTGPHHTAHLILALYKWWAHGTGWDGHKSHTGIHTPPDVFVPPPTMPVYKRTALRVAQQLPGVRDVLAERVAARFDTVADMAGAGAGEWEQVEGVGAAKAAAIMAAIHGPHGKRELATMATTTTTPTPAPAPTAKQIKKRKVTR